MAMAARMRSPCHCYWIWTIPRMEDLTHAVHCIRLFKIPIKCIVESKSVQVDMPPELAHDERDLIDPHKQFSLPVPNVTRLLCSYLSYLAAVVLCASTRDATFFLWNHIHSPGSKKASSINDDSTSKILQPLSQKKSVGCSLSPSSESSSQSSSVGEC